MKDCRDSSAITEPVVQKCPGLFGGWALPGNTGLALGQLRSSSPGQSSWVRVAEGQDPWQRGHFKQHEQWPKNSLRRARPPWLANWAFRGTSKVFVSLVPSKLLVQLSLRLCQVFEGIAHLIVWKQRFNHKSCQALPQLSFISQTECPQVMYSSNGYWFKLWAFYKIRNYYLWFK